MRVAWCVTGSGDKLKETLNVMRGLKESHGEGLKVEVFLSKAGAQVAKYYKVTEQLQECFDRHWVEVDANTPFLAGRLQLGEFDAVLVAPATSNTVAKIAHGVSDTLVTNAAIQAVKGYVPVYIMPVDYEEGTTTTVLPNGRTLRLRVRKEDADNARKLEAMEGFRTIRDPGEIPGVLARLMGRGDVHAVGPAEPGKDLKNSRRGKGE
jgi:archaeoflavoprotein AfpA